MSRSKSGRIVLEIEPDLKRQLYLSLEINQMTLKEWFTQIAHQYIDTYDIRIESGRIK